MRKVLKYDLTWVPGLGEARIVMPEGARILGAGEQYGFPVIWALVDIDKISVNRKFLVRGTGHDASDVGEHLATFQMHGGAMVWHLFDPA